MQIGDAPPADPPLVAADLPQSLGARDARVPRLADAARQRRRYLAWADGQLCRPGYPHGKRLPGVILKATAISSAPWAPAEHDDLH